MKKKAFVLALLCMFTLLVSSCSSAPQEVVNVYNWGEYIDESIFSDFEAQTGIKVNYKLYENNEQMYAVIKGGGASYDVIFPSDYMVGRMIAEDMLEKIDYSNIPNISKIDPAYRGQAYDPTDEYSVPYAWGTVGIIYDPELVGGEVTGWDALFDSKNAGQILMFDNSRDCLGIALKYLGYSLNTVDETEIRNAYDLLMEQKPIVQAYVMDQIFDKLESGEAAIGPYYAGDYITMLETNPNLKFCLPEEGSNIFIDCVCIPKGAANKTNAEKFINFLCETDVALANMEMTGYCTPSIEAYEMLDDEVKNNPVIYPSADDLARCEAYSNLPEDILQLYSDLWVKIKS